MRPRLFINGSWSNSDGAGTIEVLDAADGSTIGQIAAGTVTDVDRAMAAAADAFGDWAAMPAADRARLCDAIADGLEERTNEIAALITSEVGTPIRLSRTLQAALPVRLFRTAARLAASYPLEEEEGSSLVVRHPVGVVAAITPWNYPLHQIAAKVAYALAAGCTVVLKPSAVAPLNALVLGEVIQKVGLPAGAFNIVTGAGTVVGEAMVTHPAVDKVSFTGSTKAGRRIAELASESLKRVTLELGGKSANILLDDLDDEAFEAAVRSGVGKCFLNSGQTCTALTRMLVPQDRLELAGRIAADETEAKYQPGDPRGDHVRVGPLASAAQVQTVRSYIESGLSEGATLVTGGLEAPAGLSDRHFVLPTVFTHVRNDMRIAREEIFGPVLSILGYLDENDAVRIANDSPYGLSGGVVGSDAQRAGEVARRLRTGQVNVNNGEFNPDAPFGGFKQSGYGRELGRLGLEEFLETSSLFR